jgi:hypothetical protein
MAGFCVYSGPKKGVNLYLNAYQLLKNDPVSWKKYLVSEWLLARWFVGWLVR